MSSSSPCAITDDAFRDIPQWIPNGGFILLIFCLCQCFWGLAFVCDNFFCKSLEILCEEWKIPNNIAGATFMAMGTSAGDLLISTLALFVSHSTIGLGTVIGSEIFNHMIICAACILTSKSGSLKLNPRTFTRDSIGYAVSLIMLMIVLKKGSENNHNWSECLSVSWSNGLILMGVYVVYSMITVNFDRICDLFLSSPQTSSPPLSTPSDLPIEIEMKTESQLKSSLITADYSVSCPRRNSETLMRRLSEGGTSVGPVARRISQDHLESLPTSISPSPLSLVVKILSFFTAPLGYLLSLTIPDPDQPQWRNYYPLTMVLSVAWMGALAEAMLECLDVLGALMNISDSLMGITISAVGASMPSLWSSVVVAREGHGDMAISNALGANTFSILIGLGLPWFSYPLYIKGDYKGIQDGGIVPLLLLMLGVLAGFYIMVWASQFELKTWSTTSPITGIFFIIHLGWLTLSF